MEKIRANKTLILLLALVAVAAGAIYWYLELNKDKQLTIYGNVDVRQVSLAFNASERIEEMLVEEGDSIKQGQLLARLNTETLRLNIAQVKAQIAMQNAILEELYNGSRPEEIEQTTAAQNEAAANYENALTNKRRMDALYEQGAISKQTKDDADASYKAAKAVYENADATNRLAVIGPRQEDIKEAEAQLEVYKANLMIQEYNLTQAELIAPCDGVIRSRLLEPGDMASSSKPVYLISVSTKKWVRAYLSEPQLGLVKPGQKAKVIIDSFPDKPIEGQVGYISDTAEFTPKTVQTPELRTALLYEVRIYVDDTENVLRLGMPATVSFD